MGVNIIQIGDKIDLVGLEETKKEQIAKKYVSQVLEFIDEKNIKIAMPIYNNRVIPLEVESRYHMCFYTARGLYQCKASVIERYKDDNVYVLMMRFLTPIEKFQRREYYRLERIIEISYRMIQREEIIYEERLKENVFQSIKERSDCIEKLNILRAIWHPATITDISGGGIRFNAGCHSQPGDKIIVDLSFRLNDIEYNYYIKSMVISSEPLMNRQGLFENRSEFIGITLEERETLIKFIFEEERKMRRRHKGMVL